MTKRSAMGLAICLFMGFSATAEELSSQFRADFEKRFKPGRTFAVVVKDKIPTTSVYGVSGNQTAAHFSIDVVDGQWEASAGFLDTDQTAADFLSRGEIVELSSISYKDNRVDMRMVSVEAHKVTRGEWIFSNRQREPVATNFKFFLPFDAGKSLGAADMPAVFKYIEEFLKPFDTEASARAFAARIVSGGGAAPAAQVSSQASSQPKTTTKKKLDLGMTPLEVIEIMGKPKEEIAFGDRVRWTYEDMVLIFENGRLKEVKF